MHIFGYIFPLIGLTSQRSVSLTQKRHGNRNLTFDSAWDAANSRATAFVTQLNLTEKVQLITGGYANGPCTGNLGPINRLGLRSLCMSDGPAGVNRADLVSVFPSGITTAATWSRELIYQRGLALGVEFREKGSHVMLGPSTGPLGRHPLGGRNWEGSGADPYLAGTVMAETVRGVQENGVQACSKHFIGNEQETQRMNTNVDGKNVEAISSNIDGRTLHELYLWPFADAVKAGTTCIMCSYNRLNGTYACEHPELLNSVLKNELGFRGYVVSDWFATHSTADAANSGLDVEMPGGIPNPDAAPGYTGPFYGQALLDAVKDGTVLKDRLDDMATRVLTPYFLLGQDASYPAIDPSTSAVYLADQYGLNRTPEFASHVELNIVEGRDVRHDHASLIRKIGAAGTVLLKNVNNTLPLLDVRSVAVFGNDAFPPVDDHGMRSFNGFDIGTLFVGGGSGTVRREDTVSPFEAIKERSKQKGFRLKSIANNTAIVQKKFQAIYPLPDVCLVFLKTWASEGGDRSSIELDFNSTAVVNNVASWCKSTVVVTHSSGVNTMPWARHPNITAILAAHYPGEQSGNSIADVLWGDYPPSGRLPYTIPETESDYSLPIVNSSTNANDPKGWQADFTEGQLTDYRGFDAKNTTPLFEFGFGLTYTTFELSPFLSISSLQNPAEAPDPSRPIQIGGHPDLWDDVLQVHVTVSNTGSRPGNAVPQLYISYPSSGVPKGSPVRVLRGFENISLEPSETQAVEFKLKRRDISYWDVESRTWKIPSGEFTFYVGFSSRDVRAQGKLTVRTTTTAATT